MNLKARRIIMFSFILAFFILGPILIFYASGYRYDLKRHKVLKTGTLMLEAKGLKNAELYINDKIQEKPFDEKVFVYNLLPGEYTISLKKETFHSWQKKVAVNSGLTTFVKDIILFQDNVPLKIIDGQTDYLSMSPDGQKIIYTILNDAFLELYFYDLNTKESNLLYRISADEKIDLSWAASSKKILLHLVKSYLVLDLQNSEGTTEINPILGNSPTAVRWDLQSDNLLYAQTQNEFYQIDILSKSKQKIFSITNQAILPEFFIEDNDIFYIQKNETINSLYKYNLTYQTTKLITEISKSDNYRFITSANNYIGLLASNQQKLYLIKKINLDWEGDIKNGDTIKEFPATDSVWDEKEKQILIINDFELSAYNTESNENIFINRYGQIIKSAKWYPDLNHVVILFENNIQILDTYQQDSTRNIAEVVKLFNKINSFSLDKEGAMLYFTGQVGKQAGLYQLKLK